MTDLTVCFDCLVWCVCVFVWLVDCLFVLFFLCLCLCLFVCVLFVYYYDHYYYLFVC